MKRLSLFLLMLGLVGTAMNASAGDTVLVEVDSKTTGGYGPLCGGVGLEPDPTIQELVVATPLVAGQEVTLTATGQIVLDIANPGGSTVDPDGFDPGFVPSPFLYFPLEEAAVDSGDLVIPRSVLPRDVGALMGAFVPRALADDPAFSARNDDPDPDPNFLPVLCGISPLIGDIDAEALFLVGSGPLTFEAPEAGTLFLGVNDALSPNNFGSFSVTLIREALVDIDIKPGSDPNCFNVNGHGVIPVAILGSSSFDVAQIDQSSLLFGGLAVRVRGNRGPLCGIEDVNGDSFPDLVCQFDDDAGSWTAGDASATVEGSLFSGEVFQGTDSICIVP